VYAYCAVRILIVSGCLLTTIIALDYSGACFVAFVTGIDFLFLKQVRNTTKEFAFISHENIIPPRTPA
jgi:hypothetical protein